VINTKFEEPVDVWDHIDMALMRNRADWEWHPGGRRIHLGAGRKIIQGFDNVDFPEWDAEWPEKVHPQKWRIPADDGTVGQIVCQFTLDHLSPEAVVRVLREAQRVLMNGGTLDIVVPHYSSQLANECIAHKSRFAIDTWRNIFSERQYDHDGEEPWLLHIGANFMFGLTERNLILVTQLIRFEPDEELEDI
jgi:hypothetical protein